MKRLTVIGNLGNDAIIRDVNDKKVISFDIAENEAYKDKEGVTHKKTTWVNCSLWKDSKDNMNIATFLKKGTQVYVEGKPSVEGYLDKNQVVAASQKLKVDFIQLLSSQKEQENINVPD